MLKKLRDEERLLCLHRQAAQADLFWHAARVEMFGLMQHDEVVRISGGTGLQHKVICDNKAKL